MRPLFLTLLLIPALTFGSLADGYQMYLNEIRSGIVREKIVKTIALNRTCTILLLLSTNYSCSFVKPTRLPS